MTFELMGREAPLVEIRSIECFIDINATSPAFPPDRVPTTTLAYQSTHGVLILRVVSCPISACPFQAVARPWQIKRGLDYWSPPILLNSLNAAIESALDIRLY